MTDTLNTATLVADCQGLAEFVREDVNADRDTLAFTLNDIRSAKQALSDAERTVEALLVERMGTDKTCIVAGVGTLERKASQVRPKWEHDRLRPRLAALSRDERILNEDTGEIEGEAEAALRVFLDVAAVSYYRRTALKQRGLDPDDFCESEGWKSSVRIIAP